MTKSSNNTKVFQAHVERKLKALHFHKAKRSSRERWLVTQRYNRLSKLPLIVPTNGIKSDYLRDNKIFFDTDAEDEVFEALYNADNNETKRRVNLFQCLETVDSPSGCRVLENRCTIIVTHIPRNEVIDRAGKNAIRDYVTIEEMLAKNKKSVRGVKRQGLSLEYATIGAHARRYGRGISMRLSDNVSPEVIAHFKKIVQRIQYLAAKWLPVSIMKFVKFGKQMVGCTDVSMGQDSVWSSAAMSYNYVSAAHVDDDCFLSAITVMVETSESEYTADSPVAVYFCIPECGKAIGLRPGDVIFFNPLYFHCISKRTKEYENKKVFVSSIYLKTAVVGGNDNRVVTDVTTTDVE